MSKYLALIKIFFNSAIIKRADFFGNIITTFIQILASIILWYAIFKEQNSFNGYTLSNTITYYILVLFVSYVITINTTDYIANSIKSGSLSQWLLKPWDIMLCELSRSIGNQIYKAVVLLPVLIIVILCLNYYSTSGFFTNISLNSAVLGSIFVIIGFFINCVFEYSLAMLAFWLDEVWSIKHFKEVIADLLGGRRIPISFFPPIFRSINNFFPFQFIYFIPIEYYLGKRNLDNIGGDFMMALLWIIFFIVISKYLYFVGLKRYGAFGN